MKPIDHFLPALDELDVKLRPDGNPLPLSASRSKLPPTEPRQSLQDERLLNLRDYWSKQLEGAPSLLQLPSDHPRPPIQSYRGASYFFALPKELSQQLEFLSAKSETTLFMTLLAAFKTLLYRYSGQEDFIVGTPSTYRNHQELESLIGLFTNTLALRTNLSGNPTFNELLQRVQQVVLDANEHKELPLAQLMEILSLEHNPSHNSLFQVMFGLRNVLPAKRNIGLDDVLRLTPLEIPPVTTKFDLTLEMQESTGQQSKEGLIGRWVYNTDLFEQATIERMAGHFQVLLESIVSNPDSHIEQLPLLTKEERHQLLVTWNDTKVDYAYAADKCIHHLFEEQVERTPDAIAVVYGSKQLSYRELNAHANQLAHYLIKHAPAVGPEVLVGICIPPSLEMMIGLLGILKAGAAYVPLDPNYPKERLAFMLKDSDVRILLTLDKLVSYVPYNGPLLALDSEQAQLSLMSDRNPLREVKEHNLAYCIYTSGSTGKPKGVLISHRSLTNLLYSMRSSLDLTNRDTLLAVTTVAFDIAALELYLPLLVGAQVLLVSREIASDANQLLEKLRNCGATVMQATPATWHMLLASGWRKEGQKLKILSGGEALPSELANQLLDIGLNLWNLYGPTETTIWSTLALITKASSSRSVISIGRPIANTQVYLLDQHLQPVPIGVPGELHIGGAGLARGYLNRPELTKRKFISSPFLSTQESGKGPRLYKTGDLCRYLPDGNLEFLGRYDHQVKIRGFRIELGEIETVLSQYPDVGKAVVLIRSDGTDRRLVAYLVGQSPLSASLMRAYLKEKVPDYMIPAAFVQLEALPLTPNGKVDRRALPAPSARDFSRQTFVPPRTPSEEILAAIWQELLGLFRVGVHDNFFELGGHSLLATQVSSRVRQQLAIELPVRDIFESPTIADLSQVLSGFEQTQIVPIASISRERHLPLSFAQQRLWFLNQLEGASATYNIPWALRLTGVLDRSALKQSWYEIVCRHETLRATFPMNTEGLPRQEINPVSLSWAVMELSQFTVKEQEAEIQRLSRQEAEYSFDLATGPLLRVRVLRLSQTEHVLLLTMHHIISDGWSFGLLMKELQKLYQAISLGQPASLPSLPIQYADFAYWQRQQLQGKQRERLLNYWQKQLADAPPLLELPTDYPRPPIQSYQGAHHYAKLPTGLLPQLQALSQRQGCTLFMTLQAAFAVLLFRYSGQSDVLIGTAIANRQQLEIESLIGFFVNTLVLRTQCSGNPTFTKLLTQVRQVALDAYTYQDLPFDTLVNVLQPTRSLSHNPLFQVMFVLQNAPLEEVDLVGLTLTPLDVPIRTTRFDLGLSMEESSEGLIGCWEYNTDLFKPATIRRMARHFQVLLEAIVAKPNSRIEQLPLLTKEERHQLLVTWNDTKTDYARKKCVHHLFEEQVERSPDAIAVVFGVQKLSYRDLNSRANQLAHHLIKRGVGPEQLVGLCVKRSLEMVVGFLAILKAGAAYMPLAPSLPDSRLAFMLADAQVKLILTQAEHQDRLATLSKQTLLTLDSDWYFIETSQENPKIIVSPTNLAYVIYTSGSTGKPKGVLIEHKGLCNLVQVRVFNVQAESRVLQFASLNFDVSIWEIAIALCSGAKLIVPPDSLLPGSALREFLFSEAVTYFGVPPSLLAVLPNEELPALQTLIVGAEPCSADLVSKWSKGRRFCNVYGPTEATIATTLMECTDNGLPPPIGRPMSNIQTYILDHHLQPMPIGVPGELHIGGVGLARGYLNRPQLTKEKFIPNPFGPGRLYKTGDLCRYLPDGNIEFLGRADYQVKIRGFRIELGEIETVLSQHRDVRDVAVLVRVDGTQKRLVAYLVGTAPFSVGMIRTYLKEKVPDYMIPAAFVPLEALPLTPNGKVDRRALLELDIPGPETDFALPQTKIERILAQIIGEVIQIERVGIHNNFFDSGAHSLHLVQIQQKLQNALGKDVPLVEMFNHPTIHLLANYLNSVANDNPSIDSEFQIPERAAKSEELRQRRKKRRQKRKASY